MTDELDQAATYRRRAEELRAETVNARDPDTKKGLMQIADNYLQLAKMIEERNSFGPRPKMIVHGSRGDERIA